MEEKYPYPLSRVAIFCTVFHRICCYHIEIDFLVIFSGHCRHLCVLSVHKDEIDSFANLKNLPIYE